LIEYEIEAIAVDHAALLAGNLEACAVVRCRESGASPWPLKNDCRNLLSDPSTTRTFELTWQPATERRANQAERMYQPNRLTEEAAIGVAAAAFAALAEGEITEVTQHGTGVDYWVDQRRAVLEISGIRKGSSDSSEARHAEKTRQLQRGSLYGLGYPGYVFVVAFGDHEAILSFHQ
jgi:hypothetical protein